MKRQLHYTDAHNLHREPRDKNERWFSACDYFLIRAPLLPLEQYFEVFSDQDVDSHLSLEEITRRLKLVSREAVIREAISLASPSLMQFLHYLNDDDALEDKGELQKYEKTLNSFYRYFIRMTTRTTPFGLFSGVGQGICKDTTHLDIGTYHQHLKRARPDMEWIYKIIRKMESDPVIFDQLKVFLNRTVMIKGDRAKLPFRPKHGAAETDDSAEMFSSIRLTDVVRLTFEAAEHPIQVMELKELLLKAFPDATTEIIAHFLQQLVEQEFILSELRPPLMDHSPFHYIFEKIKKMDMSDYWTDILHEIDILLRQYNQCMIGEGEKAYRELCGKMLDIIAVKTPVQVDVKLAQEVTLPRHVLDDVALGAEVMCRLFSSPKMDELDEYLNRFLEKYGVYQEVPINELFDEDWGLGIPKTYRTNEKKSMGMEAFKRNAVLFQWLSNAIANHDIEIVLSDEQLEQLTISDNDDTSPESMEVYYSIFAESPEKVDSGDYKLLLGPSAGSNRAGKTFGRFLDMFSEEYVQKFSDIYDHHRCFHPDALLAEMVFMPDQGKISNISLSKNFMEYEIVSGTTSSKDEEQTLHMDDLLIGATHDRFYVKSRRLGKEIIPLQTHMLNYKLSPHVFRFLTDITNKELGTWSYFDWGPLEQSPFLPRLVYGKIVISAAQWRLGKAALNISDLTEPQAREELFHTWREQWNVPRYVYLTMGDNRLLLDLCNLLHIKELLREMSKMREGQELLLTECLGDPFHTPLHGTAGRYMGEFVFPLKKKKIKGKPSIPSLPHKMDSQKFMAYTPSGIHRGFLPGGEWLYLKLYGVKERETDLISLSLDQLRNNPEFEDWSKKSYFLRYVDPEHHIRLRFQGEPGQLWSAGLAQLNQWAGELREEGLITHMVLDTYLPELERYGGQTLMDLAEQVFDVDSRWVIAYMAGIRSKAFNLDIEIAAVINIIHYLSSFGLTIQEQVDWLEGRIDSKPYMKAFRDIKKALITAVESEYEWIRQADTATQVALLALVEKRQAMIQQYAQAITLAENNHELTNHANDILGSIIHMHLNRLLGVNREREMKCMALAKHTAANLLHRKGVRHVTV
ncbi:lantibiotic dehydratase [Paenibacillus polymyxa]|uniref:lantibiotic dehydratase n=1 Tax=Paenibacillus polymyxa TaxID=1406 RepID=UPI001F0F1E53|nr:lantibiotic dehydratase [Paenibacillus polymyxa]UMR37247.1 lantibiotic dehydratase [Paenibacillus polymyxa]